MFRGGPAVSRLRLARNPADNPLNLIRFGPAKGRKMENSLYIARLIGPVLVAVAASLMLNRQFFASLAGDLSANRALILIAGLLALIAGLAIVDAHNIWTSDWRVIVTLFGWLAIAGGLFRIVLPDLVVRMAASFASRTSWALPAGAIAMLLGLFLSAKGHGLV